MAFVITFARVRSQIASNMIGQHVQIGDGQVLDRLRSYSRIVGVTDPGSSAKVSFEARGRAVQSLWVDHIVGAEGSTRACLAASKPGLVTVS